MNTKQLQPHEYSEDRKRAEMEIMKKQKAEVLNMAKEMNKINKVPSKWTKIKCTKCNTEKACSEDRYEKLKKENKIKSYKCRDCKKQEKENGKSKNKETA